MFESLPSNVLSDLIPFLNFKDLKSLSLINKIMHKLLENFTWIIIRDGISRYFPAEIELFCNFGDNFELKEFLRKKTYEIIKKTNPIQWKRFLKKEATLRKTWVNLLEEYLTEEECQGFVNSIFYLLKEPSLPLMKLRRENVGMYAKSCFQNKLCDVLYEGSSIPNAFFMMNDDTLAFLKADKDAFLSQFLDKNKNQLKMYRWYGLEAFQTMIKNEQMEEEKEEGPLFLKKMASKHEDPGFLMRFYEVLFETILFQLEIVAYVLELQKNPLDLLFEYNTKWNTYVASLSEYENAFGSFVELFNNLYEMECKKYPAFPKFSLWRLMQKAWISKIFTIFEQKLVLSFLNIVNYNRCLNLSKTLTQIEPEQNDKILNFIDSLFKDHTMELLSRNGVNFKPSNGIMDQGIFDSFNYSSFNHEFFNNENSDLYLNVASSFFQSVLDLSANEINVHYLGHTKFESDIAFENLNSLFLEDSKEIYGKFQKAFGSLIFDFKDFLKQDYQDLVDNLNEKTLFSLRLIQLNVWIISYKEFFMNTISQKIINNPAIVDEEMKNNQMDMDSLISELFDEHNGKFREYDKNELSLFSDALFDLFSIGTKQNTPETIKTIENILNQEKNIEKGLHIFLKTISEINIIENEKPELDMEIEDLNKYRKLPFPLEESEKFFYCPFRNISLAFLEDVYQKYLSNLDTHDQEGSMSQEDFDEYNQSENDDSLETYNEEEEELKLSKRTSEVMPEELPGLKKEKSNKSGKNKNNCKAVNDLQQINEDENEKPDKISFFLLDNHNFYMDFKPPKSVRSNHSKVSKVSKGSNNSGKKMSEEIEDLEIDLPQLKLK